MRADEPGPPGDLTQETRIRLQADSRTVRDCLLRAFSMPPLSLLVAEDRSTAEIVLAEVLNNVVEHAYAQGSGPILLTLSLGDGLLHCRVEDEGAAMPGGSLRRVGHPIPPICRKAGSAGI